jgi:hypothetical protein
VPDPPQLRQGILPEPAQVRQPESPSDQRLHRHSTRPEPPHVAQRGRASHLDAAGSPSPSDRFAIARPASMPSPADAITTGATILDRISSCPELWFLDMGWKGMEGRGRGRERGVFSLASFRMYRRRLDCRPVVCGEEKIWGPCVPTVFWPEAAAILCRRRGLRRRGGGGGARRLIGFFRWFREGGCVARLVGWWIWRVARRGRRVRLGTLPCPLGLRASCRPR